VFDISQGAIQYKDLLAMPFDEFDAIVDKVKEIQDKVKASQEVKE
jgi:hypothetical protein